MATAGGGCFPEVDSPSAPGGGGGAVHTGVSTPPKMPGGGALIIIAGIGAGMMD